MNKKIRDFIFNSFVVIFIIATTLLSLYASGYKFNLNRPIDFNRLLVKTGMLDIETEPKNALIYLNGKLQDTPSLELFKNEHLETPAKIRNLIPGEYNISLEKKGYWPYQKKITIESRKTTILENINLFKSSNPSLKAITREKSGQENIILSLDNKYIYLKNSQEIINIESGEKRNIEDELANLNSNIIKWCEDNMLFIGGYLFSPENPKNDIDYTNLIGSNAFNWKFDQELNRVYYQNNNSLNYLDYSKEQVFTIIKDTNFIDYLPQKNYLFLITQKENNSDYHLSKYSLDENKFIEEISLLRNSTYSFDEDNEIYLSLFDKQNKTLYLINKEDITKGTRKIDHINDWQWSDNYTLFYINDWEVNIFNLKNGDKYLINRYSEVLKNIILNKSENYLIINSLNNIRVIDLNNNYSTKLLEVETVFSPVLDTNNNYLYFWSKLKEGSGVYRIEVK